MSLLLALALFFAIAGCGMRKSSEYSGKVKVSGSTTVLPVSQEAATQFSDRNPAARIDVQGGGSSVGIAQLQQGVVEIGNSSRDLDSGEGNGKLKDHRIAFDVIALVVHPLMPISNLSGDEARDIFTGMITNWKAVGGPDEEIVVVIRDQASGTREMFDKKALGSTDEAPVECAPSAIESSSNGVVREIVAATSNAIGYISYGYVDRRLKAISFNGAPPTVVNAGTGRYSIARYLHMFTRGEPKGAVKGYLDFVLSDRFQREIVATEYVPVKDVKIK